MLTLSPAWHGRLRAAGRVRNLLLQTLVIHPALLFFLLFVLGAHNTGSAGQMLLNEAERLVRDAPAGQVWGCAPQATREADFPPASLQTLRDGAPVPAGLKTAPPPFTCVKAPESREAWINETNGTLLMLYKTVVLLSILASLVTWGIRRLAKGACA